MFLILSSRVGHGELAVNQLGYNSGYVDGIRCCESLSGCDVISAHAPSEVLVEFKTPYMISGLLNASAWVRRDNPVEFWVDYNYIGQATDPGQRTRERYIEAGKHILHVNCLGNDNGSRHSLWALRTTADHLQSPLSIMTIGAYPAQQAYNRICIAAYSAAKQNIWLNVCGVGYAYHSHYFSKVTRMKAWIEALPEHVKYIAYVDGGDSIFLSGSSELLSKFLDYHAPIVMGAESQCAPIDAIGSKFPTQVFNRNYICAGNWIGERAAVLKALDTLTGLSEQIERGDTDTIEEFWPYRYAADNDQFLWQIAYLKHKIPMKLDSKFSLFANIAMESDPTCKSQSMEVRDNKLVIKQHGDDQTPCVAHFSCLRDAVHPWAGLLGSLL